MLYDRPKIDCHCHVFDPDAFPYAPDTPYAPAGGEIATADYFGAVMDAYGVRHALLVGPNSGYGLDNRCMLDAIARGAGRFKGIAVLDLDCGHDELQELKARGVVGAAFNVAMLGLDFYARADALFERLAALDLLVQVQVQHDDMVTLAPRLRGCDARILVDHHGRPDLSQGLAGAGFAAVLALAGTGRAYVKLSGHDKFSQLPYPFADTEPYTRELFQAYGASHCLWASDWPHLRARQRLDYGTTLSLFAQRVTDPADQQAILWDTPRRLFGFA